MATMITKAQITLIHTLLNKRGWMDEKVEFVKSASRGRCTSTKDLTGAEATVLINHLQGTAKPQKSYIPMIWALAYEAGIIYGNTPDDLKMNAAKLDQFCRERGAVKKNIGDMSQAELIKTIRQFVMIRDKVLGPQHAKKITDDLLKELGIEKETTNQVKI